MSIDASAPDARHTWPRPLQSCHCHRVLSQHQAQHARVKTQQNSPRVSLFYYLVTSSVGTDVLKCLRGWVCLQNCDMKSAAITDRFWALIDLNEVLILTMLGRLLEARLKQGPHPMSMDGPDNSYNLDFVTYGQACILYNTRTSVENS